MTMKKYAAQLLPRLLKSDFPDALMAAGEILILRDGIEEVIDRLRAGADQELCARRLEMLVGRRKKLNGPARKRVMPKALRVPKPAIAR